MPVQNSLGALYNFKNTSAANILRPGRRYFPNRTSLPGPRVGFTVNSANILKNPVQTPGYTIEYWVRPVGFSAADAQRIGNFDPGFTFHWGIGIENIVSGSSYYRCEFDGFFFRTTNAILSSGSWAAMAITFENDGTNSTIRIFKNGILQNIQLNGTGTSSSSKTFLSSNATYDNLVPFSFSSPNQTATPVVYYDEVRISDICRYTANYTPTNTQFVNDSNTLALFHFNYNLTESATNTIIDNGPNKFTTTNTRTEQQLGSFPP